MTISLCTKPTNQDMAALHRLIGEAVYEIQHLEGALTVSITLKKDVKYPPRIPKEEADNLLKKYRSRYTLGQAIKLAKKNTLYSDALYNDLEVFLEERNWLIHKFVHHDLDDMHLILTRHVLFQRIKAISNKSKMLQQLITADLLEFAESAGKDMSRIRAEIKQYCHEDYPASIRINQKSLPKATVADNGSQSG